MEKHCVFDNVGTGFLNITEVTYPMGTGGSFPKAKAARA
jgi:hypothetical protein